MICHHPSPLPEFAVGVEGEGAGVGAIVGVVSGDGARGYLSGGEILDLDFEVEWCWGLEEFCPGGYCRILGVGVMAAEELLERYAGGEWKFPEIDLKHDQLQGVQLRGADLSGADLKG